MAFVSVEGTKVAWNNAYDTELLSPLKEYSYGFDFVRNGTKKGTEVACTLLLGNLLGPAMFGAEGTTVLSASELGATKGIISCYLGFGNNAQTAWSSGASLEKGLAYATAASALDGILAYVGKAGKYMPWRNNQAGTMQVGLSMLDSLADSALIRPGLKTIYTDNSISDELKASGGWENVASQVLATGALGTSDQMLKGINNNELTIVLQTPGDDSTIIPVPPTDGVPTSTLKVGDLIRPVMKGEIKDTLYDGLSNDDLDSSTPIGQDATLNNAPTENEYENGINWESKW